MSEIRRLFDAATAAAKRRSVVRGVLGKPDGTIVVPLRPTFVWVRVSAEGGQTVTIARNPGVVANRLNLPVEMEEKEGVLVIIGVDGGGRYDQATRNDTTNQYGITAHTHAISSGLSYEVESLRLEPGRVKPATGFNVYINPFRYRTSTGWETWPGGTLNLSAEQPTDPDVNRWVIVGIDPATNTAVAFSGPDYASATPLSVELLDEIVIGDIIPCAAVKVSDTDTNVDGYGTTGSPRYVDAHGWFNDPRLSLFDDAEGDPANVATTPLDGTSLYPSRRDHVHTIAAATVTAAMLVDGTALAEILDDDGAGSLLDADLLDGVQGAGYSLIAHTHAYQPLDAELTALAGLVSAADRLPYFTGVETAALATFTTYARTLADDPDAATAQATLGLVIGTNVQAYDAELAALAGLTSAADKTPYFTGSGTAALADLTTFGRSLIDDAAAVNGRATLGLIIGTDVQAYDATLLSIAALGTAADKLVYTTGVDTWAETALTAAGRAILDDADATAQRATLGLTIGTNVQAFDAELAAIAGLTSAADQLPYFTGSGTAALTTLTGVGRALVAGVDTAAQRASLGLTIGASVQAYSAELAAIAGLVSAADKLPYFTGVGTASLAAFTAAGRALIDDADAAAQRVTLGLVIGTNVQAYDATLLSLAALGTAADKLAYTTGVDTWAETGLTAYSRTLLDDVDAAAWRTTLGLNSIASTGLTADSVTNTYLADMAQTTVKGRALGAGTGDPTDLTAAQLNAIVGSTDLTISGVLGVNNPAVLTGAFGAGQQQIDKTTNGTLLLHRESADSGAPTFEFLKRRTAWGVVSASDRLGSLAFSGADSVDAAIAAQIYAEVDGTPGSNDMPGRLILATTPDGAAATVEGLRVNALQNTIIASGKRLESDEIRAGGAGGLKLYDDGGNAGLFVEDGGQVGVGTASPAARLHVSGGSETGLYLKTTSASATIFDYQAVKEAYWLLEAHDAYSSGAAGHSPTVILRRARNTEATPNAVASGDALGVIGFRGHDGTSFQQRSYIQAVVDAAVSAGVVPTALDFATGGAAAVAAMRIDSAGLVGIGTTAPQGIVHAHDGIGGMLFVSKSAVAATAVVLIPNGTGDVVIGARATCVVKPSTGTAQTGTIEVLNGASSNIFNVGGTEILTLRVNADGSLDVRRTAGTLTYTVSIHVVWQ